MTDDVFRIVMYDALRPLLTRLRDHAYRALEVSGTALLNEFKWLPADVDVVRYPDIDLTDPTHLSTPRSGYDLVFADQVLEHVTSPASAVTSLHALLRPGGYAVVTSVCLFPPHDRPADYWRFTPEGLRRLFYGWDEVTAGSWGNWEAARAALDWQSLNRDPTARHVLLRELNDPSYPVVVWAWARRPRP